MKTYKIEMKSLIALLTLISLYSCSSTSSQKENDSSYKLEAFEQLAANNYEQAIQSLDKYLKLNPTDAIGFSLRGFSKWSKAIYTYEMEDYKGAKKQKEEAIKDYSKATELDDQNTDFYSMLGFLKRETGDYQGAVNSYQKVIEINPNIENKIDIYFNIAMSQLNLDDPAESIKAFDKVIELDEKNARAYLYRGQVRVFAQDFKGGCIDYRKAVEIDPSLNTTHVKDVCKAAGM